MALRVFIALSCVSGAVFLCVAGLWLWDLRRPQQGGCIQIEMGRGYHTFEFFSGSGLELNFASYTQPVTWSYPNARFFRTAPCGWPIANLRQKQMRVGQLICTRDDCDYLMTDELFITRWQLQMPYWLPLLASSALPTIAVIIWFRRRGIGLQRGFAVREV